MDLVRQLFEYVMHLGPESMNALAHSVGAWLYVILFAIVFAETGLVITPFLPGDSLLFAAGAVAAHPDSPINLSLLCILLIVAAILGDAVNYVIGYYVGPKVFASERSRLLNRKHLLKAHEFYEKHGGVTIILARFIPIVRTFAPFVAGIGRMNYAKFALYNVTGGIAWVLIFLIGGWKFGGLESVQKNFKLVIVAIIFVSILPGVVEYLRVRMAGKRALEAAKPSMVGDDAP
ncbi:DedA family protein [Paludisphaera borealis]|uniref:Putative membrane protein n=1 Tax=Paludisphaera borealis TaxID=1387353 RepID=A0A1U7CVA9_9BACT|nr:DedA family protein [Paludisphaera borealis]APW62865.1 putative membrane protein [Paludisphaera borealis]